MTETRSIRFPASGHIWIPEAGRRAAAAGLSMHSPCHPMKVLAHRGLYLGVRLVGSRIIPGERAAWEPPLPADEWESLQDAWRGHVGRFDGVALYRRPQAGRAGFAALLLDRGRGVAFARVHPDAARVANEAAVLEIVHRARPRSFRVARPIASDLHGEDAWLLTTSVPNYPLGAVRRADTRALVARELSDILLDALPRPAGIPAHWVPAHGDFTPWNLRTELSGAVRVIDWEDAGYAPPGVDVLYGGLTAHETFGTPLPIVTTAEARDWIDDLLSARIGEQAATADGSRALRGALRSVPVR
jgi:hypothetical protein